MDDLNQFPHAGVRAALRSCLHDLLVLASRFDELPSFKHVVTDWLFDVHVLACLNSPDRGQRVPVIRSGNAGDMNRLVVEALSHVGVDGWPLPESFLDRVGLPVPHDLIDIDDRRDLAVFAFAEPVNVRATASVHTDHRDAQNLGRSRNGFFGREGQSGATGECRSGCGEHRGFEKVATREL